MNEYGYLNQIPPPIYLPKIFAPGIISTDAYEFAGTFSPDGTEYFFTRRPTYNGSDNRIYFTKLKDTKWTTPKRAPFAKDVFEMLPYITPKGDKLFFSSYRKKTHSKRTGEIWYSLKINRGWSDAIHFDVPFNRKFTMYVTSTSNDTLYFTAKDNEKRGIFRSVLKNEIYQEPEFLPAEINSINPAHPFISLDESFLIVDSQLKGMGMPELFISFQIEEGEWTPMRNMGKVINSTSTEYGASVTPDGKYLFFHRRNEKKGDIYWGDARMISNLREQVLQDSS